LLCRELAQNTLSNNGQTFSLSISLSLLLPLMAVSTLTPFRGEAMFVLQSNIAKDQSYLASREIVAKAFFEIFELILVFVLL